LICDLERQWLGILRGGLGGGYEVHEGPRAFLLTDLEEPDARELLAFVERTVGILDDALEGNADQGVHGRHVVIVISEEDDYYSYVSHHFPDGHYGLTAGVCIRGGEIHVVVNGTGAELRRTLAHELGHDLLSTKSAPLWLEEGVVQVLTRYALDEPPLELMQDAMVAHGQCWHWHGLAGFWDGSAFFRPDDVTARAYELAELLARGMNRLDAGKFDRFLATADREDAGESACRAVYGVSLLHFVGLVLGAGPWFVPEPAGGG